MSSYSKISKIAPDTTFPTTNPLTYCTGNGLERGFTHGGQADVYGQYSRPCQLYVPEYCAQGWDEFCEISSQNSSKQYPVNFSSCNENLVACNNLTHGEGLIHNTALRKYLVKMNNGIKKYQPFDPNDPNSPMVSYWENSGQSLIPEYEVDPKTIDDDVVMDKILAKPCIAFNILINIYNTMKRNNRLSLLKNTKLGNFYQINPYFVQKGGI